jgi:hypothetical protein
MLKSLTLLADSLNDYSGELTMSYQILPLDSLTVNRANDRHGELENETAAIAWLFANKEAHMRSLAKDIVETGEIYEPPLVSPDGSNYTVFDGNRRVTCLKLLHNPRRAPTTELQEYFRGLSESSAHKLPIALQCQIETDRDRIDDILLRRHTGTQNGIGQSTWDDRMKANFVARTGKESAVNVADEIEKRLAAANLLPAKKIPRSTLNRLLSAEAFRNRVGFSIQKKKFEFTRQEPIVLAALARIAHDLATGQVVLGNLWDVDGKSAYLDTLEAAKILPTAAHALSKGAPTVASPATLAPTAAPKAVSPRPASPPQRRTTLIPQTSYAIAWAGRLQRHRAIWEELQFHLDLTEHPNAISVLFRVLLELSADNYINRTNLATAFENDKLAKKVLKIAEDLHSKGKIDKKYRDVFQKMQQLDPLVSMDTLNRYVHSPNFAPSPEHLTALWDTLADFIVLCLNT